MEYDIVIVGAGIAGLTAAIYAARAGKSVLVLERKVCGGQIITSHKIRNYPGFVEISGKELMDNIKKQAEGLGVEIKMEEVVALETQEIKKVAGKLVVIEKSLPYKIVKTDEAMYRAKTVILAMGREEAKLTLPKADKLAGISYCATCDGELYKDKIVAVLGGGNTALYDALYLADIAKKVYVIYRRERFRGDDKLVEELKFKENVELVTGVQLEELLGDEKIEGVKVGKIGRWIVEPNLWDKNDEREIKIDGLFVAIGQKPDTTAFMDVVKIDKDGYIEAGEDCQTSEPGIYVAGDCRTKDLRQLVTAAADGAIAATEAVRNLE